MNNIRLSGRISKEPVFSHEIHGEKFYEFEMCVARQSETEDYLNCLAPGMFLSSLMSDEVSIIGEVRTRNIHAEDRNHLQIFVFVKEVYEYCGEDENEVELDGYICKPIVYRHTPLGREIADVLIACNRPYGKGKSYYIPSIAWGRSARRVGKMEVGTHIKVFGRLQSREYLKQLGDGTCEDRVAYELSIATIKKVGEENE